MVREGTAAFGEACGFIVEVADEGRFTALAATHGAELLRVGATTADYVFAFGGHERALDALYETWSAPLRDFYAAAVAR